MAFKPGMQFDSKKPDDKKPEDGKKMPPFMGKRGKKKPMKKGSAKNRAQLQHWKK